MALRWVSLGVYGPAEYEEAAASLAAACESNSAFGPTPIGCGVFPVTALAEHGRAIPAEEGAEGTTWGGRPLRVRGGHLWVGLPPRPSMLAREGDAGAMVIGDGLMLVAHWRTPTGAPTVRVEAAGSLPVTARRLQGCPAASAALRRYGYTDRVLGPAGEAVPGEKYSPHWWPGPGQCVW